MVHLSKDHRAIIVFSSGELVLLKQRRKLIPNLVVDEIATTFGNLDLRICVVSSIVSFSNHRLSGERQGLLSITLAFPDLYTYLSPVALNN